MEFPVSAVLHRNDAPPAPFAVNSVLPQLLLTEIEGADGMECTVNVAALEVALPAILVHRARYCLLLSAVEAVKDKVLVVAPPISFHCVPLVLTCH